MKLLIVPDARAILCCLDTILQELLQQNSVALGKCSGWKSVLSKKQLNCKFFEGLQFVSTFKISNPIISGHMIILQLKYSQKTHQLFLKNIRQQATGKYRVRETHALQVKLPCKHESYDIGNGIGYPKSRKFHHCPISVHPIYFFF